MIWKLVKFLIVCAPIMFFTILLVVHWILFGVQSARKDGPGIILTLALWAEE